MVRTVVALGALLAQALPGARVTVSFSEALNACREIRLPQWKAPPLPATSYDWSYLLHSLSDWDFRKSDGGVLVGLYGLVGPPTKEKRIYSPDRYLISLPGGQIRKASESDWTAAEPYPLLRDSTWRRGMALKDTDHLIYEGKDFSHRGHWLMVSEDAARISTGRSFLSTFGWDGVLNVGDGLIGGPLGGLHGHYYADIHDTSSGSVVLGIDGSFRGTAPYLLVPRSQRLDFGPLLCFPVGFRPHEPVCPLRRPRGR